MNKKPIVSGLILVLAGTAFAYFFIWRKLEAMANGAGEITYSLKAVSLGPLMVLFGLYYLISRPEVTNPREMNRKQQIPFWIFFIIAIGTGILTAFWFENQAEALGYHRF